MFETALALLDERRFTEAVNAFTELVALNPELTGAYGNRGLAYLNLGLEDEARSDFQTVLQLDPNDPMGYSMLAEVGRFREPPETTLAFVAHALELSPDEPQAHFIRGWLFARAGQYDMAAEDLSRYLELSGANEDVQDLLEACKALSGTDPVDELGQPIEGPDQADAFLGKRGWSFNYAKNPDYDEQGLPCPYAHCIRNRPPHSADTPDGCPVFGYACPGNQEQVVWCREHSQLLD